VIPLFHVDKISICELGIGDEINVTCANPCSSFLCSYKGFEKSQKISAAFAGSSIFYAAI